MSFSHGSHGVHGVVRTKTGGLLTETSISWPFTKPRTTTTTRTITIRKFPLPQSFSSFVVVLRHRFLGSYQTDEGPGVIAGFPLPEE
jgi:hypothetical protein